jgi:hypothetical protein
MTNQERIDDINEADELGLIQMNGWEVSFTNDIYLKLLSGKELTWKQQKKLIEIWEKIE